MEAQNGHASLGEDVFLILFDSKGMSSVVNNPKTVFISDILDNLNMTGIAIHVYWEDGSRARGDSCFDFLRIERKGSFLDVTENWGDAVPSQGMGSGYEAKRCGNNLSSNS